MQALRDNPTVFGSSYESRENCSLEWATKVLQPKSTDGAIYIAEYDQQLLGLTSILRGPGIKTRHSATIGGVFIKPGWRHLGIIDFLARFRNVQKMDIGPLQIMQRTIVR